MKTYNNAVELDGQTCGLPRLIADVVQETTNLCQPHDPPP